MKSIKRKNLSPDEIVAIPNDLVDKGYLRLFKEKKQLEAVFDLIKQTYKAGLQIGREEKTEYYEKILDEIYK